MSKTRAMQRMLAFMLALVMLITAVPYTAQAETTASSAKLYAFEITTGSAGTDLSNVQSIVINYKNANGKNCIYSEELNEKTVSGHTMTSTYYSLQIARSSKVDFSKATSDSWTKAYGSKFIPYTTQVFFFRPYEAIASVESVQIITCSSGKWEIQGLRITEVSGSVTTKSITTTADCDFPSYSGKCLVNMSGTLSMQWSEDNVYSLDTTESKKGAYLENCNDDYDSYEWTRDDCVLELQIADEYMAGLESLDLATQYGAIAELLTATVYYKDIYGDTHKVSIPLLTSFFEDYSYSAGKVHAYAQQGNTIVVDCTLPGFSELITDTGSAGNGITVSLGLDKTTELCYQDSTTQEGSKYISNIGTVKVRDAVKKAAQIADTLSITDVKFYKSSDVDVTSSRSGGEIAFSIKNSSGGEAIPDYYYSNKKSSGVSIAYDSSYHFTMKDNRESKTSVSSSRDADVSNLYLVEIDTYNSPKAASMADLTISFSYTTYGNVSGGETSDDDIQSGVTTTSSKYDVKTKVREFYGYWPGSTTVSGNAVSGNDIGDTSTEYSSSLADDYAYYSGMSAGGKLRFLVTLSNVDTFKSVTLTLKNGKEWQTSNVSISRVTGLKHRTISNDEHTLVLTNGKTIYVNHNINREVTSVLLASSNQQVLFRSGSTKTITFSDSQSAVEDSDVPDALDPNVEEMSYEEACQSMGYSTARITYDVDVVVAGSSESNAIDGDSGSQNLFYFRLNFENGSSAYVLANQQLSSDGFRAGQTESFSISMNQSYGELISVDIIPDDTSSKSDIYDKLNIDTIRVTRNDNSSVSRVWEVSSPGWVGIDYQEESTASAVSSNSSGRSAGEITQSYLVDSSSYSVKLMFAIATGEYAADERQFSGTVQATLNYTDSSGESQSITFDMVEKMYEYNQMTPVQSDSALSLCKADTSCMFRANSTDRFYLNLTDVKSVDSMKIRVCDDYGTTWKIVSVGVSQVSSVGNLFINPQDEYDYTGSTKEFTHQDSTSAPAYTITTAAGTKTDLNITFKSADIDLSENTSTGEATSTITRKPAGTNDTLNIFVEPSQTSGANLNNYDVKTEYVYTNTYGRLFQNGALNMRNDGSCYYALGVSATGLSILNQIKVTASAKSGTTAGSIYGDKVIIQRIRSGTLLGTYLVDSSKQDLTNPSYIKDLTETTNQETQTVTLYFGDATTKQALSDSGKNVAVSIGFKTTLGNNDQTYYSPYVYLTDEQYQNLYKNMMAEIDFHIPYLKEITEIRVAGIGGVDAVLDSATIGTYTNDTSYSIEQPVASASAETWTEYQDSVKKAKDSRVLTGWYSFSLSTKLTTEAQKFKPTNTDSSESGALVPVNLTLTAQDTSMSSDMDLAVIINYLSDENGNVETQKVIPNVKEWIADNGTFTAGGSITLSCMLSDVSTITGISIRTTGGGTTYPLDKVVVEWNKYGQINTITKAVSETITSEYTNISFLNGSFQVSATSKPADGSQGLTLPNDTISDMNFALTQGDGLSVTAVYTSSLSSDTPAYTLCRTESSGAMSIVNGAVTVNGYLYNIDTTNLSAGDYVLYIYSRKSKATTEVKFTVKAKEKATDSDSESEDKSSDSKDDDNNSKSDSKTDSESSSSNTKNE